MAQASRARSTLGPLPEPLVCLLYTSTHPDAEIYVQSIIPVSKWLNNNPDANRGYNTMANVIRLQKALVEMVNSKEGVHYVNVAECMEDLSLIHI